ncbi:hypothetical protein EYF80_054101 [Liparis tanakae]|uniref:Uncharacterized protein n=1 Tax=Liparis tanakae TaxID=230148 RepID=A0A4Z2F3K7_9TELE|nr:hypothetical protein EYF80_054101 [Liparis tanakae]
MSPNLRVMALPRVLKAADVFSPAVDSVSDLTHSSPGPTLPQSTTASLRTPEYNSAAEQGSRARGDKNTAGRLPNAPPEPPETGQHAQQPPFRLRVAEVRGSSGCRALAQF